MSLLDIARLFLFVREVPPNRGLRVQGIQTWSGGQAGDSWCCEAATMWLDLYFQGQSPIPRRQACQDVYAMAKLRGWVVSDPQPGDLYLFVTDDDHAHHIGVLTSTSPLTGISGNTSSDGLSSNGDGVYEHALTVPPQHIRFVRVPGVS